MNFLFYFHISMMLVFQLNILLKNIWDSLIRNGSEENAQNDYLGSLNHEMIDSNNQSSRLKEVSR